ncbi:MAG: outer membrane protein assembly factor BamA [SAR324 cluster bacterium]|nr:outer membrane protein assembly factor BamA [SAR324 cluster bacterium]
MTPSTWKKSFQILLFSLLILGNVSFLSFAQELVITQIEIEGTNDLESSQILFNLESQVSHPIDRQKIISDIKTIYQMGIFRDVRAEVDIQKFGHVLRFTVEERPRVQTVRIRGRNLISEDDITEKLKTKNGEIYDPVKVKQDVKIISDLYREKGYVKINVTSEIDKKTDNQYIVDFVINERPKVFLTNIYVSGNKLYSDLHIKRFILSAEIDCVSWASSSGIFQEERVNQDLALIAQNYLKEGYIKVFIDKPKVILAHNPDYSWLEIYMNIKEGEQYFTGTVEITGDLLNNKEDLIQLLQLKQGEVYNPFLQNQDRAALNEAYQEQGYAFVRIIPRTSIDEKKRIVHVNYQIIKNEKAYIGRINFSGNTETRDFVIRREFEVREGELYNGKKLRVSQANLERLGFFEPGLTLEKEDSEDEDNILDIIASVKEAQTGTFQAQAGFSEVSKLSGGVSISKANLFGRGQTLRFSAQFAQEGVQNDFSATLTEPRLLGTHVSASATVSQQVIREIDLSSQNRTENAFSVSIGFPIYRKIRLSNRFSAVDRLFEKDVPSVIKRSYAPSLIYNTQNHPIFPSDGINTSLTVVQTGGDILGGNTRSREYNYRYKQFWSLNKEHTLILMAQTRIGFLEQIGGSEIPAEDRYRIGGISTVRGHDLRDIAGPYSGGDAAPHRKIRTVIAEDGQTESDVIDDRTRDLAVNQIKKLRGGGIFQRIFNFEVVFPLTNDPVSNVRGVVFYDAGNVNAEPVQYKILGEEEPGFFDLRHSVGAGIRMITPIGVLRFEHGHKLDKRSGESPDKFDFTISGLF